MSALTSVTPERIHQAYAELRDATEILANTSMDLQRLRWALDVSKARLTVEGKLLGSNAEAREASARMQLMDLYGPVEDAEIMVTFSRMERDRRALEVEEVKQLLRLMELTQPPVPMTYQEFIQREG